MGVFEKLKNALFEVEYVEVDEPDKKEKKKKEKEKRKEAEVIEEEKPIAKKIVLPGKREDKIEELEEEELKDDNFESRPINETIKEENHHEFKFMDDNDFKVDVEPEIVEVLDKEDYEPVTRSINARRDIPVEEHEESYLAGSEEKAYSYNASHERESKPYGVDNTYKVPVHEYGTYERKEERTTFKPSPIISPIYGILDKNYTKEDVVQKKEVRLSSSYSRGSMNVDDVRDKAYGRKEEEKPEVKEERPAPKFEEETDEDENLLIDLNDEKKPEVKEITVGDAVEYFQDLGLEYNVDYVDASKEKPAPKKTEDEESIEEDIKEEIEKEEPATEPKKEKKVEKEEVVEEHLEEEVEDKKDYEVKEESKATPTLDDDDNLFDLIDSMYKEND